MRSYNSLNKRTINTLVKNTNTLAYAFQTTYLGNTAPPTDGGGGGGGDTGNIDLSSYALKTYVDGSLNNIYANYALQSGVYTKTYIDASFNGVYTKSRVDASFGSVYTKTYVDASFADVYTKSRVDASFNGVYTKTYIDASFNGVYTKTYVDASFADVYTKTYVDGSLNNIRTQLYTLTNGATSALDTLAEIGTAINSDASFGIVVYQKIASSDASINDLRSQISSGGSQDPSINSIITKNNAQDVSINSLTTSIGNVYTKSYVDASFADVYTRSRVDASFGDVYTKSYVDASFADVYNKSRVDASFGAVYNKTYIDASFATAVTNGRTADLSLNGNLQLGSGTKSVGINKTATAGYALDVSGASIITGNLSVVKTASDPSYSHFDLSSVNINLFNTVEKFTTLTWNATTMTLNYTQGSIFYTSTATANTTALAISNVPTTLNRSITVTLMTPQSGTFFLSATAVTINGTSVSYIKQDGTAFAAPSATRTLMIYQFVIIYASATPTVIGYMTGYS